MHRGQVGVAGIGRRSAHGHEQQTSVLERGRELGPRSAAARGCATRTRPGPAHRSGSRLARAGDLLGVDVYAPDLAAQLGEAGGGHQPDVAVPITAMGSRCCGHRAPEGRLGATAVYTTRQDPLSGRFSEAAIATICRPQMRVGERVGDPVHAPRGVPRHQADLARRWRRAAGACRSPSASRSGFEDGRVLPGRPLDPVVLAQDRIERERHPVAGSGRFPDRGLEPVGPG